MKTANRKLDLILEDGSGGFMSYREMISELTDLREELLAKGWVSMRSIIPMVAQNAQRIGLAKADRGDLYPTPSTSRVRLARENNNEDRLSGIRTRRASDVINELEGRIARLERQATTKTEAYETLRSFMAQNRSNKRLLVELGGYLKILKEGGDLTDRDLTTIRKQMHRNNASDLADMFRSNPTGRSPSPRVVKQPPAPAPAPAPAPQALTTPKSLLAFARAFKKKVVGLFENSSSVTHTRKYDKIRKFRDTGDKEFYQTVLTFKGSNAAILLIEPVNDDYTFMPNSWNVFWKFKDYNTDYIQKELGNSGLLKTTTQDIIDFLLKEAQTTAGGFMAYRGQTVSFLKNDRDWEFMLSPGGRERQDHWHFNMDIDYEDDEEDWGSDAWDDWSQEYERPLLKSTEEVLEKKFPILKANPGDWNVAVDEKGYVWFNFRKSLIAG